MSKIQKVNFSKQYVDDLKKILLLHVSDPLFKVSIETINEIVKIGSINDNNQYLIDYPILRIRIRPSIARYIFFDKNKNDIFFLTADDEKKYNENPNVYNIFVNNELTQLITNDEIKKDVYWAFCCFVFYQAIEIAYINIPKNWISVFVLRRKTIPNQFKLENDTFLSKDILYNPKQMLVQEMVYYSLWLNENTAKAPPFMLYNGQWYTYNIQYSFKNKINDIYLLPVLKDELFNFRIKTVFGRYLPPIYICNVKQLPILDDLEEEDILELLYLRCYYEILYFKKITQNDYIELLEWQPEEINFMMFPSQQLFNPEDNNILITKSFETIDEATRFIEEQKRLVNNKPRGYRLLFKRENQKSKWVVYYFN